ncbi:bacterial capsule synthesis protein [Aeromicrobium marinum DSM 15272]|uniref:Bacterial capsule synthesis protein n=1 Tax=Aeromicrobium marinum DSM 15272 TaxID=585531 RepID=E2SEH8_9ACTN|nr:CapA family protein [Aeromicrobium marinum]EFQ82455.1 bacterial capsule synthesis protein [Aeromicrobium marinum DSM 15272]
MVAIHRTTRRGTGRLPGLIAVGLAACLAGPAACTTETREPERPAQASAPQFRIPLAVVTHLSRGVDDVSLTQAEAVRAGEVTDWSALDGVPGPLRLVDASDPLAAVAEVAGDPQAVAVVPADTVDPRVRALRIDGVDPLRAEGDVAFDAASDEPAATVVRTTITGDIMLGRRVGRLLEASGDPAAVFRPLAERLAAADLTVGNLESTLSMSGPPTQGGDSFGADPSVLAGLELAGYDLLSVGNNHLGDFGLAAINETIAALAGAGFATVGGGANLTEARRPTVLTHDGISIGFVATDSIGETPAATDSSPGTNRLNAPPRTGPLDSAALDAVAADIRTLDAEVDIVIALPHWGTQYTNVPDEIQRTIATTFIEAGADLVAGGHPHWVQGWETIGDATVVHSLGNFVFDMDFLVENTEGVFLEVVSRGDRIVAVEPVPYVIGDDYAPRVVDGPTAQVILDRLRETSAAPWNSVRPRP